MRSRFTHHYKKLAKVKPAARAESSVAKIFQSTADEKSRLDYLVTIERRKPEQEEGEEEGDQARRLVGFARVYFFDPAACFVIATASSTPTFATSKQVRSTARSSPPWTSSAKR